MFVGVELGMRWGVCFAVLMLRQSFSVLLQIPFDRWPGWVRNGGMEAALELFQTGFNAIRPLGYCVKRSTSLDGKLAVQVLSW